MSILFLFLSCDREKTEKQLSTMDVAPKAERLYAKEQKYRRTLTLLNNSQSSKRTPENMRPKTF
jgi:hypothetical protein